jgi:RHS repeat-associated protein
LEITRKNIRHVISRTDVIRKLHYIQGGNGLAAIVEHSSLHPEVINYTYTDYQGNLLAVAMSDGWVRERYAYDPWGKRRDPDNWTLPDTRASFLFSRGYTLHEHLDDFKLINMNGRVYDPLLGQFLSPDPHIQAPGDWQNYNRYAYAFNNPLIYTDPDGEIIVPILSILAFTYAGGVMSNFHHAANTGGNPFNPGDWNWSSPGTYIGLASGFMTGLKLAEPGLLEHLNARSQKRNIKRWRDNIFNQGDLEANTGGWTLDGRTGRVGRYTPDPNIGGNEQHYIFSGYSRGSSFVAANTYVIDVVNPFDVLQLRFSSNAVKTMSALIIPIVGITAYIMEPPGLPSGAPGSGAKVHQGVYELVRHWRDDFHGGRYALHNPDILGARGIVVHDGAYPRHTRGCPIPSYDWEGWK